MIDWTNTADDQTLIQALRPLLADRMWFCPESLKWYARDKKGNWRKMPFHMYWTHLAWAADQLPAGPFWDRSRHRLKMAYSMQQVARMLARDCFQTWPRPADLP